MYSQINSMAANHVQLLDSYGNSLPIFQDRRRCSKYKVGLWVCPAPGYTMKCKAAPHVLVFSIGLPSTVEIQHQSVI
jgi:hypothetical protein